jgi:hypothetical protein
MLRKLTLSCAVAGVLLFGISTAFADNQHHNNNNHNNNNNNKHNNNDNNNHHDHDGHRHYYHGRWWDYGVGPCWNRTPFGWVWFCD